MIKDNNVITLTIVANMTSNYSESLGNISSIQKVIQNGKTYGKRSKESLKYSIMNESEFYDDLEVEIAKGNVTQKKVDKKINIENCRALEGGYMSTTGKMFKRNSSFYLTDGISIEPFQNDYEFHHNLGLSTKFAKKNNYSVGKDAKKCGLNPFNYE